MHPTLLDSNAYNTHYSSDIRPAAAVLESMASHV